MSLFSLLPQPKNSKPVDNDESSDIPHIDKQSSDINSISHLNRSYAMANENTTANTQLATSQSGNYSLANVQDISQKVALQGHRSGKIVYASYEDLIEKNVDDKDLVRPSKEEELQNAEQTKYAIEARIHQKIKTAYKLELHEQRQREDQVDYVKYTPLDPISGANGQTKIIRIVEEERDPLEPSRFKNKKLPARPPSPPVPVMRAPEKKLTNEEMDKWKIPPCVSNWKNKHGYVVPLDKRMAADGRNLKQVQINDRFATLAKTFYDTEKKVREDIEKRKEYQRAVESREKEKEEENMRKLALQVRNSVLNPEEIEGFQEREELRKKAREEALNEHRKEILKRKKAFYSQLDDDDDRDVSNRISLGQHVVSTSSNQGYHQPLDSRLEQLASGDVGSGFGDDDDYNVYDKPLSNRSSESVLYRPRQNLDQFLGDEEQSTSVKSRFTRAAIGTGVGPRDKGAPVEFKSENEEFESKVKKEKDEFDFLTSSNDESNKRKRALDHIGNSGFMNAAAGGAPLDLDHYRASKRQRIGFSRSSTQQ